MRNRDCLQLPGWILIIVIFFILEWCQRMAVISFATCKMFGMVAVWPVNDLFAFFNRFFAGVTCAGEAGCHLPGVQWSSFVHFFGFKLWMKKSRELPSTAWNLSFRKVQPLRQIQVPEFLLHQGWFARCPGYTQQLFQPGKQPTWSISGYPLEILPNCGYRHLNCAVCGLILLCLPKMKSKAQRQVPP